MVEQVRQDPDRTLARISELAAPDSRIYTAQLKKALREGGQLQFNDMVHCVSNLLCIVNDNEPPTQPCFNPLELTVRARGAIPTFTKLVDVMISTLCRNGHNGIAVSHRPVSKGTYRILEKCLLKVPGEDILTKPIDASKVLDVAGCLIACCNFEEIQAVMELICNAYASPTGCSENLVHEIHVQRQKPTGIEKKDWRGITIISEVYDSGTSPTASTASTAASSAAAAATAAGIAGVSGKRHVPLMMRLTSLKESFNSLWPGMFILPGIVHADVDHHSEELCVLNVGDLVEVYEQLQTRQRHWYGVYGQYYDCLYTKVRITCQRTGVTGWMSQRLNIQDGNEWVDFMEPVLPTTLLGPQESYMHTIALIGPGNNALELVAGDHIISIEGKDTSTMHPHTVAKLLNNHDMDTKVCVALERWDVCRIKDTWTGRSKAGWRDYKVNIRVAGVIFEIQIVLAGMMTARSRLDGKYLNNQPPPKKKKTKNETKKQEQITTLVPGLSTLGPWWGVTHPVMPITEYAAPHQPFEVGCELPLLFYADMHTNLMTLSISIGHVAYNDFRFLYECILYIGDGDLQRRLEIASESKLHESYAVGRTASAADEAAEALDEALLEIEVLQEDVKMKNAVMQTLKADNRTLKEELVKLKAECQ